MMEDRRYRGGSWGVGDRVRSRSPIRGLGLRESMGGGGEWSGRVEDRCRYLKCDGEFDQYRGTDSGGGYGRMGVVDWRGFDVVGRDGGEECGGFREYDRSVVRNDCEDCGGGREYDRRHSPMIVRDGREDCVGGREYDRMRVDDRRRSSSVVRDGREDCVGGREYDRMRVDDRRRSSSVLRDGREDCVDGREYDRMRVDDRRRSSSVVRDGREDCIGGREYDRMRVDDRMRSSSVVRDSREDCVGGREYDRRDSPMIVRDGQEDCGGGREYDRMRVDDRRHSSSVVRDGREDHGGGGWRDHDRMRVDNWRRSPSGREVEGDTDGREDRGGGGRESDLMRAGDWGRSPRGREVEGGRDGWEHQKGWCNDGEFSMGREASATWSAGEHDRQIVQSWNQQMKTTCVGDLYEERTAERKYSLMRREIEGMRSAKEYEGSRMLEQESSVFPSVENRLMDEHIPKQVMLRRDYDLVPPDVPNRGRDYDEAPPDVANGMRDCDRAPTDVANRMGDCDIAPPDIANSMRDYDRPSQDVANRMRDYDNAPPDVANRMRGYDRAPPDVANSMRDYERPPPDVANRIRDYDKAPPHVANRMRDRAPPDVAYRGSDYDRAPPDVANRSRDDDGGLPWSMILSRDDRGTERDNGNNNGLLERNCYRFDESLPGTGPSSLKFQNNILEERWKADTLRSNREFGVSDARLCNDGDSFIKQSLDVGLLKRLDDCDRMSLNFDNGRLFSSSYPSDSTVLPKYCDVVSRGHLLTPHLDNADHKHVDLHENRYLNKLTGDRAIREDRNTLDLLENRNHYIPPSSLSKAFSTMSSDGYGEDLPPHAKEADNIGSGGVGLSCGISGKPPMYDRHGEIIYDRQSNDDSSYSRSYFILHEEQKSSAYQEVGRSEDDHICAGSCNTNGNSPNFVENNCCQDISRAQNVELKLDREHYHSSKQHRSSDGSQPWDLDPYPIKHSMPGYVSAVKSSHLKKQDIDILEYGKSRLQYDVRIDDDFEPNQHLEYLDHRKNYGSHCHHDTSELMRLGKYCSNLDRCDRSPTQNLSSRNLNSSQPFETMLQHSHLTGNLQSACQTNDRTYLKEPYDDFLSVSKKSRSSRYEKTGNGCRYLSSELTDRNLSQPLPTVSSQDTRSSGRDIKSRLGPSPQDAHASRSVGKEHKCSVKKRLGHDPNKLHVTLPWIKNLNAPNLSRTPADSNLNHDQGEESSEGNISSGRVDPVFNAPKFSKIQQSSEGFLDQLGGSLEANEKFRKGEPLENSEEFKQLVQYNFFKFVKQLNETLVRRRKFVENGKCGGLNCLVCGSSSPEFEDTKSLVMHALSCDKIGSKCQHLGFHKALCALMGWRSAEVPDASWVCERLNDAETFAIKADLIIWPPAVVVHNITITDIPEKRITLSVEEFERQLRDMGFGDKTKVTLGRPANQGIMVVSFGQTFSALQEAERLHKIFSDFNRGRIGVLQLDSNSRENYPGESPVASGDELHPFLYGYLGLAGDLDKLDFEIKRRSLIKSKMEMEAIEDALVKKEDTADATSKKEAIEDALVKMEDTADATNKKEAIEDALVKMEDTADATNKKEAIEDAIGYS